MPIRDPKMWVINGFPGLWIQSCHLWARHLNIEDAVQARYLRDGKYVATRFLRMLELEKRLLAVIKDNGEPPMDQVICDVCGMPSPSMTETADEFVVCQSCLAHTPHRKAHAVQATGDRASA